MIVHPKVDGEVEVAPVRAGLPDDHDRGRLLSTTVSARVVTSLKRGEQPHGELTLCVFERVGHPVDDLRSGEDVALTAVATAGSPTGPLEALVSREGRGATLRVYDAELARRPALVRLGQLADDVLRRPARREQAQAVGPVAEVGPRLRRDRPGPGPSPRDDRPDREEL